MSEQDIHPTGGPGTIRPYALKERKGVKYQINAILQDDETIDYFDIYDQSGSCLNEGEPWFIENEKDPDATISVGMMSEFLDSLSEN